MSQKLVGPREWVQTRYYIGALQQEWNPRAYADQRRFLDRLTRTDPRINVSLGRLEPRHESNPLAQALRPLLSTDAGSSPAPVIAEINRLVTKHEQVLVLREKAVDIMLAVDLIRLRESYDAAYLLSADGDFTPAVQAVAAEGADIYAASPDLSYSLRQVVRTYIHLKKSWFSDCYRTS
ncbi:MAG TPA: NYN domain-containing protein [Longimicrobium sp.]|nr:NYN domain-containing protein [Longimicrobium sp.]